MKRKRAYLQKKRYTLECTKCHLPFKGRKGTHRCENCRKIAHRERNRERYYKQKQLPKPPRYCSCGSGLELQKRTKICTACLMTEKVCPYCGLSFKIYRRHKERASFCSAKCVKLYYGKQNVALMAMRIKDLENKQNENNKIIRAQQMFLDELLDRNEEFKNQLQNISEFNPTPISLENL